MPEYIGRDGLTRHVPRRERKRAHTLYPALALALALASLAAPLGLILGLTSNVILVEGVSCGRIWVPSPAAANKKQK